MTPVLTYVVQSLPYRVFAVCLPVLHGCTETGTTKAILYSVSEN